VKLYSQFYLGDDVSYAIKGTGSSSFQLDSRFMLHIEDILYVPGLIKNIILVGILEDKGHKVIFMEKKDLLWPNDTDLSSTIIIGMKEGEDSKV